MTAGTTVARKSHETSGTRQGDLVIPLIRVAIDAVAIEGSFLLSYWIRFRTPLLGHLGFDPAPPPPIEGYIAGSGVMMLVWLLLFRASKVYRPRRRVSLSDELISIARWGTAGMLILMSAAFLYSYDNNNANRPGRGITRANPPSAGLATAYRYVNWRTPALAAGLALSGTVTVDIWSATNTATAGRTGSCMCSERA